MEVILMATVWAALMLWALWMVLTDKKKKVTANIETEKRMSEKPGRVQRKREKGWRVPDGAILVSRPGLWGNPYRVGHEAKDNAEAVAFFERDLMAAKAGQMTIEMLRLWRKNSRAGVATPFYIVAHVKELAGKELVCWCGPDEACHADVLLMMANE